jgi:hypothetical protein
MNRVGGVEQRAMINVTGLGGYLLANTAAARSKRKEKDWCDIAYILVQLRRRTQRGSVAASDSSMKSPPSMDRPSH